MAIILNTIYWSKKALKQLRKLPLADAQRIYRQSSSLAYFPHGENIKKLSYHPYDYRLRIQAYRVLFNYDGQIHIIHIGEVKKRNENTY